MSENPHEEWIVARNLCRSELSHKIRARSDLSQSSCKGQKTILAAFAFLLKWLPMLSMFACTLSMLDNVMRATREAVMAGSTDCMLGWSDRFSSMCLQVL